MKNELRILVLEDVAADVVRINHELRKGGLSFQCKRVETKQDFLRELEQNPPDIILSDHGLPTFDGFTALAVARDRCPDTPFIFVTGSMGEEMAIDSLRSGASDYVLKESLFNLAPAVERALRLSIERSRRKQLERELLESEERYRLLVTGVKDYAIFMLDPNGLVTSWNTGAEWITGFRANEIIGRDFTCFYTPEDRQSGRPREDLDSASGQGRREIEGWRLRKGGSSFWAHTVITALRNDEGRLRGFAKVIRDVTDQRQTELALRRSEQRCRRLVERCPDGLIILQNSTITFANSMVRSLLKVDKDEELVGRLIEDFIPEAFSKQFADLLGKAMRNHFESADCERSGTTDLTSDNRFQDMMLKCVDGQLHEVEVAVTRMISVGEPALELVVHDVAARPLSESRLRESEAHKSAILATSLDAIISIDHTGTVLEWNPAAERIFGHERSKALGRPLDELIVPRDLRDRYLSGLADYLLTGVGSLIGRPIEMAACKVDGTELPVELAITRITDSDPPVYTAFIRDITDRKRTEEALRMSEARKSAIIEGALDAIISIDHEGKILEWNPAAEQTFGFSRAMVMGKEMSELIVPPSIAPLHQKGMRRYLKSGRSRLLGRRVEMSALRANGGEFPVELAITKVPTPGQPMFTGFIRDITDRKSAEEALRKSEERFRMLVEGVTDYAICMLDSEGTIISWNAGGERIEGYGCDEILGQKFNSFFLSDDIEQGRPEQALAVATAEGRCLEEGWRVRKDRSTYWASTLLTALHDEKGHLYGFSYIVRDITDRKQAEDDIRQLNAVLERRVDERTAELHTAYKEMEAFSYSISHDLRAPLVHISGFVEMLQVEGAPRLNTRCQRYLQTISDSSRKMGAMIDGLLGLSRMSRSELQMVPVDLSKLAWQVVEDLSGNCQGRDVKWNIEPLPVIHCDATLMRQVMFNLLSNALKYTRSRKHTQIDVGSKVEDRETVIFVRDNGVGFDMKYAGKLFGVFQRLHSAGDFEGTGIGLAIVRRIIERHGGRIWAEGVTDGGATFSFTLPDERNHNDE